MKCDDCKQDISGTYFEVDGKTICGKDYDEVRGHSKMTSHRGEF